jgi:hypothetical protein
MRSWTRTRSLGATVLATAGLALTQPLELDAQRTVSLGDPLASYAEPFSLVGGIRELEDGRVLVSDPLEEALYALDPGLTAAETIARQGQGPDEYRQPDGLLAWPGDSTLMLDLGNGRMTIVAPDYAFARTIPVVQQEGMGLQIIIPGGVDRSGTLYYQPRGDGVIRDSAEVVRWHPDSGEDPVPVAQVKLTDVTESTSGSGGNVQQMVMPVPLSPEDGWAVGLDGSVAIVRSADYHVDWVRPDGSVISGPAVPYEPVPIRGADREEWAEALAASGMMMMVTNENGQMNANMRRGGGRTPAVDRFEWPEFKPPFAPESVRVDPLGYVWVERYVSAGDPKVFDVFDGTGRHVAEVSAPARSSLQGFGDGTLYFTRWDELGFRWLSRYARPPI